MTVRQSQPLERAIPPERAVFPDLEALRTELQELRKENEALHGRVDILERAAADLANDSYAISGSNKLRAKGHGAVAALMDMHPRGDARMPGMLPDPYPQQREPVFGPSNMITSQSLAAFDAGLTSDPNEAAWLKWQADHPAPKAPPGKRPIRRGNVRVIAVDPHADVVRYEEGDRA